MTPKELESMIEHLSSSFFTNEDMVVSYGLKEPHASAKLQRMRWLTLTNSRTTRLMPTIRHQLLAQFKLYRWVVDPNYPWKDYETKY